MAFFEAQGWNPAHPISQYELGNLRNFVYLAACHATRAAAIVDPQSDLRPLEDLQNAEYALQRVLLTHSHFDHVAGLLPLLETLPDLRVSLHEGDWFRLEKKFAPYRERFDFVVHQSWIEIGNLSLQALHTPGHSRGGVCYFLPQTAPPCLLTGDTLFIRDCGRTDLETGSDEALFRSLQGLKTLPKETVILPGHHYTAECASTLEKELQTSPPLQAKTREEFEALP